jgi:hypothetical protein
MRTGVVPRLTLGGPFPKALSAGGMTILLGSSKGNIFVGDFGAGGGFVRRGAALKVGIG